RWCGVERASERWTDAQQDIESLRTRARKLEAAGGDELHAVLWKLFDALKLKGIVAAADEHEDDQPALRHETDRAELRREWEPELRRQLAPEPALLRRAANRAPGNRIFVADLLLPAYNRASGARRMFELLRLMAEAGHAVTFVAADNSDDPRFVDELRRLGIETHAGDPERAHLLGRTIDAPPLDLGRLLAETDPDLAFLCLWYVAERYLEHVRRHAPRARVTGDAVAVPVLRAQRNAELAGDPLLARAAAETRLRELAVYRQADALVAVTEPDADAIRAEIPGARLHVLPNIHDVTEGAP